MNKHIRVGVALSTAAFAMLVLQRRADRLVDDTLPPMTAIYRARCNLTAGDRLTDECLEAVPVTQAAVRTRELRGLVTTRTLATAQAPLKTALRKGALLGREHLAGPPALPPDRRRVVVAVRAEDATSALAPGARVDLVVATSGPSGPSVWSIADVPVLEVRSEGTDATPGAMTLAFPADRLAELNDERRASLHVVVQTPAAALPRF